VRAFYKPVKEIFTGPKLEKPDPLPSPKEDEEKARKAADEASRKARSALAAQERGGRPATLVGAITAQANIASQRRTLGGA
jgi:hypothetical protein